jgi:hypothetical protein
MAEDREQPGQAERDDLPAQRGVIDGLEQGWARIALDDGQRLDWPRDRLPREASEGMVIELTAHGPGAARALPEEEGTWEGTVEAPERDLCPQTAIWLGGQRIVWPTTKGLPPDERVVVRMELDPEATQRRRKQVQDLINDLFG